MGLEGEMMGLGVLGMSVAGVVLGGAFGFAQTTGHRPKATMAVWTPEVQQTLGVPSSDFTADGLNKLTKAQLQMLESAVPRPDPKKVSLNCSASTPATAGRVRVLLTVAGDDTSGQIAGMIRRAVASLDGVDVVDAAANADRVLNVVIQEQTIGKRTIGFTASYLTGTPCVEEVAGKKTDVELKGTLGTYTDPKGADLATDLAKMLSADIRPLRGVGGK